MKSDSHLSSVLDIKKKLLDDHDIEIKPWQLLKQLHDDLNLRYKRINSISWQGNSAKNKILRQQFAMTFLKLDLREKLVINVDETWLGMSDFRRMKWCSTGRSNSVPKKNLQPRISMITSLDTTGSVMLSLLQANSNSSVMELFFTNLMKLMEMKNENWRDNTIIMLDNAPYHTSNAMMEFYQDNRLPIIFTGPHSYSASPIELFFAAFKKADINPAKLPLGKS
jgi:hypothetical protein